MIIFFKILSNLGLIWDVVCVVKITVEIVKTRKITREQALKLISKLTKFALRIYFGYFA